MRRGTPSAYLFGNMLRIIRGERSLNTIAARLGLPGSNLSQIEHGRRALKKERISKWAYALDVDETYLEMLWHLTQGFIPQATGGEVFYTNPEVLSNLIKKVMRKLAPGRPVQIDVSNIKKETPIIRNRPKAIHELDLYQLILKLDNLEKERVRGYTEALLEKRKK